MSIATTISCDFCLRSEHEVEIALNGHNGAAICIECVQSALTSIIGQRKNIVQVRCEGDFVDAPALVNQILAAGLTQKEIERRSGVKQCSVSALKTGRRGKRTPYETVMALAKLLEEVTAESGKDQGAAVETATLPSPSQAPA